MLITKLRKVGGSRGVILSKEILRELDADLSDEFEVTIENDSIVLKPHNSILSETRKYFEKHGNVEDEEILLDADSEVGSEEWVF